MGIFEKMPEAFYDRLDQEFKFRAAPDSEVTEQALANTDLTVQISTKLTYSHVPTGRRALILPALGRRPQARGQDHHFSRPRGVPPAGGPGWGAQPDTRARRNLWTHTQSCNTV